MTTCFGKGAASTDKADRAARSARSDTTRASLEGAIPCGSIPFDLDEPAENIGSIAQHALRNCKRRVVCNPVLSREPYH